MEFLLDGELLLNLKITDETIETLLKPYLQKISTLSHMIDRNVLSIIQMPIEISDQIINELKNISTVEIIPLNAEKFSTDIDEFAEKIRDIRFDEDFEGKIFILYGENQLNNYYIRGFSDYTLIIQIDENNSTADEIWKLSDDGILQLIKESNDDEFEDDF